MAVLQRAKALLGPRFVTRLLFGLIFLLVLLRCLFTLDPDFGWHIASGQYMLTNGIPATDIYTYTASGFPWIHHEWLADIVNAGLFAQGGYAVLAVFHAALWTAAIWLMAGGKHNWKSGLAIFIAVLAAAQFIAIRDTVWTALFLAITHRAFHRYRAYLPLLFIIWANLHGGFVIGLAYIAWRIAYERSWHDSWIVPAAIAATFINPYGIYLYREIFATLFDTSLHTKVNEWQRWAIDATMIILPLIWAVPVAYDSYKKRWRGIVQFDVILLIASFWSLRHFVLFALFALPRLKKFYSRITLPKWNIPKKVFAPKRLLLTAGAQVAVMTTAALVIAAGVAALHGPLGFQPEKDKPVAAINSLRSLPCKGNIFNHYDIGGYLIWKYPEQKVYIDGRMPSWQWNGANYMDNYLKIMEDESFQRQQFDTYHIACAIIPSGSKIAKSLEQQGWKAEINNASGWALLRK